jgi:alpha-L-fucosidase 2
MIHRILSLSFLVSCPVLKLLTFAGLLLTPLFAQTPPADQAPPVLPATERTPPDEAEKTSIWRDRAPLSGRADTPAGARLLWYRQPARDWHEALPLGSGRLGAMIFGGVADERHQLNVDSLWDGSPLNADNPQALENLPEIRRLLFEGQNQKASDLAGKTMLGQPSRIKAYQTLGELYLEAPGLSGATAYARTLDLETATATVRYQAGEVTHARESFASAADDVIVTRFTASKSGSIDLKLTLKRLQDAKAVSDSAHPDTVFLEGHIGGGRTPDRMRFHAAVRAITEGGETTSENGILTVSGADSVILLVAAATDYLGFGKGPADPSIDTKKLCLETLDRAAKKSFGDLKSAHIKEYHSFFHRSSLAMPSPAEVKALPTDERLASFKKGVPDPDLAALYYDYGKYLLIGSSRPGALPANLQGLWNWQIRPAWNADFHANINLQMNYWPAHLTGLSDCELPLIDLIESLMVPGTRTAKATYDAGGWVVHHLTDAWGFTAPADGVWGVWPMGAAWLAAHPWQHYLFTQDKTFLRDRAWPIMQGAAAFMLDFLVEAPAGSPVAGKLVTNPSHSPENAFFLPDGSKSVFTYGATMDLQIIRELLENCIAAEKILRADPAFRARCEDALARLAPVRIASDGRLMEWIEEYREADRGHRHVSHLYGLHPANQITPSTPDFFEAARKSLDVRGNGGTGWSLGWKINLWARLRDGDRAHLLFSNLLRDKTLPNLFDTHPPFQIDGNFGATAAIAEMLLQSHVSTADGNHQIDILPALPSAWPEGTVKGLRSRGGRTVDINWKDGKLVATRLTAMSSGPVTVGYGEKKATFTLKAGQSLVLDSSLKPNQ